YVNGAADLPGSRALLSDLGVCVRQDEPPLWLLDDDGYKAPELLDPALRDGWASRPEQDVYGFGRIIEELPRAMGCPGWLREPKGHCLSRSPQHRPSIKEIYTELFRSTRLQPGFPTDTELFRRTRMVVQPGAPPEPGLAMQLLALTPTPEPTL